MLKTKHTVLKPLALLCGGVLFGSCMSPLYYVNDPVVFGNVRNKGDINIAGGLNAGQNTSGGHLHASVAVGRQCFLVGSFTNYSGNSTESTNVGMFTVTNSMKYSGTSVLGAVGYYKAITRGTYFEISGGGKLGSNYNLYNNTSVLYRHIKWFVQPGLSLTYDNFQFGIGFRTGVMDFFPAVYQRNTQFPDDSPKQAVLFIDPAFSLSGGGKYIKVGMQVSVTVAEEMELLDPRLAFIGPMSTDPYSVSVFLKVTIPSKSAH